MLALPLPLPLLQPLLPPPLSSLQRSSLAAAMKKARVAAPKDPAQAHHELLQKKDELRALKQKMNEMAEENKKSARAQAIAGPNEEERSCSFECVFLCFDIVFPERKPAKRGWSSS